MPSSCWRRSPSRPEPRAERRPLPRGRHKLPREVVAQSQRERLIAAFTELVYEEGFAKASVARIAKRAGVSSADFYKHFKAKDDCFLAAYDDAVERIRARVLAACAEGEDWPAAVRAALAALLGTLAADPAQARLVLVEGLFGGRPLYDRYQRALDSFAPYLREGPKSPPMGRKYAV